jgi:predicted RNase H-like HicB family nuclease
MTATFWIHLEAATSDVSWWAETADIRGLSVAAPTLTSLRRLIDEAVAIHLGSEATAALFLVADEHDTGNPARDGLVSVPPAAGVDVRQAFVTTVGAA